VTTNPIKPRAIPLRTMNRPTQRASALGNCVTWRCVCGLPAALQARSGSAAGPTRETVTVCPACQRVYFVIPMDSRGVPIEVIELFGLPEAAVADETAQSAPGAGTWPS
jgi:hypothetical protein